MKFNKLFIISLSVVTFIAGNASAFCGLYVSKADTSLFNESSKVVIARDGDRTVVTMASDYEGEAKEFAMVIPVPTILKKDQIHITENKIIDHLDAYTAPRLVEYFDGNPCNQYKMARSAMMMSGAVMEDSASFEKEAKSLGVTIEEQYTVGEYDIMILSAKHSGGLQQWLSQNGYKVSDKANKVLSSYIKQGTKFFIAKVNLEEHAKKGGGYLRPISMAFESPKFMLPIRLGTVNSKGSQDMFVFTLTKKGRVETTNYRTVKIPSNMDIPTYVKNEFDEFYPAMFKTALKKENNKAVFLEYAWDMGWCDPCAADPLSQQELQELGVFWLGENSDITSPMNPSRRQMIAPAPRAQNVFVTRLHVRYDAENFPEDLKFQETANRQNYQGRYVLRHPFKGDATCDASTQYFNSLPTRFEKEAHTLSNLTGWSVADIRKKMEDNGQSFKSSKIISGGNDNGSKWWNKIWGKK